MKLFRFHQESLSHLFGRRQAATKLPTKTRATISAMNEHAKTRATTRATTCATHERKDEGEKEWQHSLLQRRTRRDDDKNKKTQRTCSRNERCSLQRRRGLRRGQRQGQRRAAMRPPILVGKSAGIPVLFLSLFFRFVFLFRSESVFPPFF
jgi:hypothetical protein